MSRLLISKFNSKTPTIEERFIAGKELQKTIPAEMLGVYEPTGNRPDPVSILEEQAKTRLSELVPIRYSRMLVSPFAFLRGAAAVMASDLASGPINTGINVQLCGDMHVSNFGLFASAERKLVFGINDFDETLSGPWEWDLKRFLTSIVVAGRYIGADDKLCRKSVKESFSAYKMHLGKFSKMNYLDLWYATISQKKIEKSLPKEFHEAFRKIAKKARKRTHLQVLEKMTDMVDEAYRLKENAPFIVHEKVTRNGRPIDEALDLFLRSYLKSVSDERKALLNHYRIVDVARKVVGIGSVGTRCWILFMTGNSKSDPLFLQVKEAQPSVFEKYTAPSVYKNNGQRVVSGQKLIQAAPDIFLGWGEIDGIHFYVRQLRDMKGGIEIEPGISNIKALPEYGKLCAWALALAHAKSGDAAMISGYADGNKELIQAMTDYAFSYAGQTETDFTLLQKAAKSGRIKVAGEK